MRNLYIFYVGKHNEEFYALYSSTNVIRVIKSRIMGWVGHMEYLGNKRGAYRDYVGRPEGRRPLGRPRSRREDNIKEGSSRSGGVMEWIELAQDRYTWRALVH